MPSSRSPLRLLLLFQGTWEDEATAGFEQAGDCVLHREGFDVTHLPHVLRLPWFDPMRLVDRLCERYRGRVDAVWSNDEQFGCLLAAVVAKRLSLPGADPAAVARAQHKLLLRETLRRELPAASVAAAALPWSVADRRCRNARRIEAAVAETGLRWPLFCKPVKGTFSVMARRVACAEELAAHLRLGVVDRHLLRWFSRPYERLARSVLTLPCAADRPLLEEPIGGQQANVDGFVNRGEVHVLGVVDEWMYPGEVAGARHFAGFTYPSRHPPDVQQRLSATAAAAIRALGLDHGLFNVEMFVLRDGSVRVIEVNPRGAGQFATMYRDVDGIGMERLAVHLAAGLPPESVPRQRPRAGAAASFVFRRFDGQAGPAPSPGALHWLAEAHPQARLWIEPAGRRSLRREYRWLGSHRHAVLNHAAADFATLFAQGAECGRRLFGAEALPLA